MLSLQDYNFVRIPKISYQQPKERHMAFELPKLAYAYDALEPHIDARTMEIHHTKHHNTYITNLNGAVEKTPELAGKSLVAILSDLNAVPEGVRTLSAIMVVAPSTTTYSGRSWDQRAGGAPKGELAKAIDAAFGSFDAFKEEFTKSANRRFGSGWAWLVKEGQWTGRGFHCESR